MTSDYWLSKFMHDFQRPEIAAAFAADRDALLDKYQLDPTVRRALLEDDIAVLAPRVNPYLLRYYFQYRGMKDADFMAGMRRLKQAPAPHG